MKVDSLESSAYTPKYNPHILTLTQNYFNPELLRPDGRCGEGYLAPGTDIPAGCDRSSINKCCSAANQCGTDCSCIGCINYDAGCISTQQYN